ncbi:MAG: EamA family transporter RarD [Micropepsaceae bacterium]
MTTPRDLPQGILAAALSYTIWGVVVIYWKLLPGVSPWEILGHRVVWSVVVLLPVVLLFRRTGPILAIFRTPKRAAALFFSAFLIAGNWGIFIWAVAEGRIIETSLGYYINPLLAIALGVVMLGEKLSPFRIYAFVLAGIGVAVQAVALGGLPWISLVLASSFAIYGYVRKVVQVEALDGLFIETLIVAPVALLGFWLMMQQGDLAFAHGSTLTDALLIGAGAVTALPLWLFAYGARRVRLSTMGFLQYIAPTISLIIAVTVYDEPFGTVRLVSFGLIWAALALVSLEMFRRPVPVPPEECR